MIKYIKRMGWLGLPPEWVKYDKQQHGILGVWIGFLAYTMLLNYTSLTKLLVIFFTILIGFMIGFIIEVIQMSMPKRNYDIIDAIWVCIGSGLAIIGLEILKLIF